MGSSGAMGSRLAITQAVPGSLRVAGLRGAPRPQRLRVLADGATASLACRWARPLRPLLQRAPFPPRTTGGYAGRGLRDPMIPSHGPFRRREVHVNCPIRCPDEWVHPSAPGSGAKTCCEQDDGCRIAVTEGLRRSGQLRSPVDRVHSGDNIPKEARGLPISSSARTRTRPRPRGPCSSSTRPGRSGR